MSSLAPNGATSSPTPPTPSKKRRNLPGNPDPDAEVIALSPNGLMAKNRFMCEICNKGFQRDQNLQLHRRGHNLPWKLKQRPKDEATRKKVYICPEASCVHHSPSRALGDLTGIKKHFSRKHGEKKYRCDKCSKKYAVQCDWKAHSKTCGTRDYKCDCGTIFSRRDSFITHRAFCDALSEENARSISLNPIIPDDPHPLLFSSSDQPSFPHHDDFFSFKNEQQQQQHCNLLMRPSESQPWSAVFDNKSSAAFISHEGPTLHPLHHLPLPSSISHHLSATALLQKAAEMGSTTSSRHTTSTTNSGMFGAGITSASAPSPLLLQEMLMMSSASGFVAGYSFDTEDSSNKSSTTTMEAAMIKKNNEGMTRDFLGLEGPSLSHNDILFSMHSQQNERS